MAVKSSGGTGAPKRHMGFKRIKRKRCRLCGDAAKPVDFKDADLLRNYITERGKIIPRRVTGTCAKHQRIITRTVKKAREAGVIPFAAE